ncbi:MAG: hypothetical protein M9941_15460 [Anaerolineae bacterium]|nr:hypothetical protein [Anaerolineae bacterium]
MDESRQQGFTQGIGRWIGSAEVYDGQGRFVGNATDRRHVQQQVGENRVRIDLSFVGPFKFAGHYFIEDWQTHRLYQGPVNVGYAETLSSGLIDAHNYWAVTGFSQRFFLMVLPGGDKQMSLALLTRGEELIYVVVGEYNRVVEGDSAEMPTLLNGSAYDLAGDPAAGRGAILLHRPGTWSGTLATLDGNLEALAATTYREQVSRDDDNLRVHLDGMAFDDMPRAFSLHTNQRQAWTPPGSVVGSYSLSGGRALSGQFHHLERALRVWRREVVSHDGNIKAVLHTWYRGGARIGVQFGILDFVPLQ